MKKLTILLVLLFSVISLNICQAGNEISKQNEKSIFDKGVKGPDSVFKNTAWVNMIFTDKSKDFDTQLYNVTFEPKARTHWHSHPGGQILLVTDGTGYYQEKGKAARLLKTGDFVAIPPNVNHWHGAAPDKEFVHIGMSTQVHLGPAKWFGPVSDEEYNSAVAPADSKAWDKTFVLSEKVNHKKVSYKNRYGITVSADLYLPKNLDKTKKYPALVIGTPYGGVKEQGAGIYAQTMTERGFAAIAFDESYNGESSGTPRHISSPDIFVEDFSAGVDFLGTRSFVDRNRIGAIGLCGSGAFAVTAAQVDQRIKAIATASMYDMSRVNRFGWMDSMKDEDRVNALKKLGEQRWKDFEAGAPEFRPAFPPKPAETLPKGLPAIMSEFFEYYGMKRGHHPNAVGGFTPTSNMAFMNFPLMNYIKSISPRPILFIIGEQAHSRYFSEDAFKRAAEPKELYIVPGARHIDLYDDVNMIPFDKLESFFKKYLK